VPPEESVSDDRLREIQVGLLALGEGGTLDIDSTTIYAAVSELLARRAVGRLNSTLELLAPQKMTPLILGDEKDVADAL
jgi:hypothetical protein